MTVDAYAATLERVARSLCAARARAGLNERQVVALLTDRGIAISLPVLCRAECTGVIDLVLATWLADTYGTTVDGLAGRRLYGRPAASHLFAAG